MKPPPPVAEAPPEEVLPAEATVEDVLPGEAAVARAARRSLDGHARGPSRIWPFLGPAFVAAVAYIDPGNFATNIAGGAKFGYLLLWVILAREPDRDARAEPVGQARASRPARTWPSCAASASRGATSSGLWLQAEVVAMATDLAEFVGAALALNLLFGIPLFPAGLIAGAGAFGDPRPAAAGLPPARGGDRGPARRRRRLASSSSSSTPARTAARSPAAFVPGFDGTESILLATGILGATVMPHVIYLHSALTQRRIVGRDDDEKRRDPALPARRRRHRDVARRRDQPVDDDRRRGAVPRQRAHRRSTRSRARTTGFKPLCSAGAATVFGIALLASGLRLLLVGTMAGQVVMQGFIRRRIPLFLRRAITLAPALVVLGDRARPDRRAGRQPGRALVRDPVRAGAAVDARAKREVMGELVNPRWLSVVAGALAAMIIALNVFLLQQVFFG